MDLRPLNQPAAKEAIKAAIPGLRSSYFQLNHTSARQAMTAMVFLLVIGWVVVQTGQTWVFLLMVGIAVLLVGIVLPVSIYADRRSLRTKVDVALRVQALAKANGWAYQNTAAMVSQGVLFTAGHDYSFSNVVTAPDFQVGQCHFLTGSGKNEQESRYGYIVIPLKQQLPNMLLDGKSNNVGVFGLEMSNLPGTFSRDQIVSLEGDFDKYYTLYAPKEYQADVRYVFTPDLMQALIAESDSIDIEIIDNKMLVYLGKDDIGTEVFWQRVEQFLKIVGDKIQRQTARYEDDKSLVLGVVAPQGRRLKRGVSVFVIVVIVFYLLDIVLKAVDIFHQ